MGAQGQKQDDRDRNADQIEQYGPHEDLSRLLNMPLFNAAFASAFLARAACLASPAPLPYRDRPPSEGGFFRLRSAASIRTSAMTSSTLRGDCAQCAALCCIALAFDRSPLFAFDKPAGEPCANLSAKGRCTIHTERAAKGFAGCEAYDCLGAGQAVTQGLFGGANWRDDPALLRPMMRAFAVMRPAHEALSLLRQVRELALPDAVSERLGAALRRLEPAGGWRRSDVDSGRIERATAAAQAFLRSLAPLMQPPEVTRGGARLRCAVAPVDRPGRRDALRG
jgi:hypothetical protein